MYKFVQRGGKCGQAIVGEKSCWEASICAYAPAPVGNIFGILTGA